jgi:ribosome-binding protein aMBF1 (putative translation factor)
MRILKEVQFIPATGQPEYAVIPYPVYLELKNRQELDKANIVQPIELSAVIKSGENPIKHWRTVRGLSQGALAKLAEISVPYLSQLEHNLRVGSKDVLKRLAVALEVAIDQII